jgi:hypothetical protein
MVRASPSTADLTQTSIRADYEHVDAGFKMVLSFLAQEDTQVSSSWLSVVMTGTDTSHWR